MTSPVQKAYNDIRNRLTEQRASRTSKLDVDFWTGVIFFGWQLFGAPTTYMFLDSLFNNPAWSLLVTVIIVLSQAGWYIIARKSSGSASRAGIGWGLALSNLSLDALFTAGYLSTFQTVYQVLPENVLPYVLWSLSAAGALNVAALMIHAALSPEGRAQREAAIQEEEIRNMEHTRLIAEHELELARTTAAMAALMSEADEIVSAASPRRISEQHPVIMPNPTMPQTTGQRVTVTPEAGRAWTKNGTG